MKKITIDGAQLPITDRFSRDVVAGLRKRDFRMGELKNEIRALELASNDRRLSDEEEDRKDRLVKVWNVGNSVRLCYGRPLSDFGFDGADQLHHNHQTTQCCQEDHEHSFRECFCVLHFVFDHNLMRAGKPHDHHPHFTVQSCALHRPLSNNFRAHFHAVRALALAIADEAGAGE